MSIILALWRFPNSRRWPRIDAGCIIAKVPHFSFILGLLATMAAIVAVGIFYLISVNILPAIPFIGNWQGIISFFLLIVFLLLSLSFLFQILNMLFTRPYFLANNEGLYVAQPGITSMGERTTIFSGYSYIRARRPFFFPWSEVIKFWKTEAEDFSKGILFLKNIDVLNVSFEITESNEKILDLVGGWLT
ncbi:MAG: hypothetical protein ACFFBD_07095, partial [Candidatus Hodarchaeota archaeon]